MLKQMPGSPWKGCIIDPVSHFYGLFYVWTRSCETSLRADCLKCIGAHYFQLVYIVRRFDILCTAIIFLTLPTFSALFTLFSEIASKLGHRDVSNLTPTGIAIEVFVSLYPMFFRVIWLWCWLNDISILLGIGTNWRVSKGGRWHGHCRIIVFNKALNMVIEFHFICSIACQNVPSFSMWALHHVVHLFTQLSCEMPHVLC